MKDEIKEILDNTLEYLEGIDETRNTKILTTIETNILLDYITNLQEEKCKAIHTSIVQKKQLTNKLNKLTNKYNDLQKENGKLKAEIELLKDNGIYLNEIIEKADNWIDKHIETYTKNNITIIDWDTFADPRQLKNILQGGGKDD